MRQYYKAAMATGLMAAGFSVFAPLDYAKELVERSARIADAMIAEDLEFEND